MSRVSFPTFILVFTASFLVAGNAFAKPNFFADRGCTGCHTNDTVSCIACHEHGSSISGATTNKTTYAPGETVTVTVRGSSRGVWARMLLYNQNNVEIARVTGPLGTGDDGTQNPALHYPFTLTAPAPAQAGTYAWKVAWWGNNNGAGHIEGTRRNTNSFTVVAPTGSVVVNGGATYTNVTAVVLALSASGVAQMQFSNDNVIWSVWESYAAAKAWTLSSGDGLKTVYVRFGDGTGNVLVNANDSITLDTTVPTGTLDINSASAFTNSLSVTLALSANDAGSGVSQMRFSTDNTNWGAWEPFAASRAWTLAAGDGWKNVFVQFKDGAGNICAGIGHGIGLDMTDPSGTVVIAAGAAFTKSLSVGLTLSATDAGSGLGRMRFSNDGTNWSTWQTYGTSAGWTLAAGEGAKSVFAQFQDSAGNVCLPVNDTITVDMTPPTGGIVINGGAAETKSPAVTLTLAATDSRSGVAQMRFSNNGTSWSAWESYAAQRVWALPAGSGAKTVTVQFNDRAGNVSGSFADTIRLNPNLAGIRHWMRYR